MNISQVLTKLKALIYSKSETDSLLGGKANSSHTHTKSQITDFPSLATVATSGSYSDLSNKPSSMTPSSHSHGNITNAGAIGTTANKPLITTTNGAITTGSFGTTANTFCQGNDSRLSDARTPTSHTHTKSQITDFPSLATVATSGSYSDLSNKPTIPTNNNQLTNGAGYITSSSNITGTSAAANKLTTARSISASDLEFQGSANFDGSDNIKLNITQHRSMVTIGNTNNYPFHRIAYTAQETGNYIDRVITFFVGKEHISTGYGICRIVLRTNNASGGATANCEVQWLVRTSGIPVDAIQVGFNNTAAASYVDVFYKSSGTYQSAICRVISHANSRTNVGQGFAVVSTSSEANNTTASDPLTSTESYVTIAAAGTKIRGKAYTSTITASDAGIVNYATYNANGKELVNSIIKGLSVSGRTITYTKLDGTTGTITTQDTTYTIPTKTSQLTNDSGFLTSHQSLSNYLTKTTNVSEMGRYIDMHYDNATAARDFDVRLQAASQGTGAGGGQLKIEAVSVTTPNNLYLGSYRVYVG